MSFIPINKMRALREAARQGDERAKKILRAQLDGSDYGSDLDAYFAPKPEAKPMPASEQGTFSMPAQETGAAPKERKPLNNPQLEEWLRSNGIKDTDEDYDEALDEYYNEYPEQRPEPTEEELQGQEQVQPEAQEEIDLTKDIAESIFEAIRKCDETNMTLMQNMELDAAKKKGAMTTIEEIKRSLTDGAEKLVKIKESLSKKDEVSQEMSI